MHDFCFTIPYGLILACGGIIGYASKGSTASLAGGVGTGLLLILAGYLSLKAFGQRKNSYQALILETESLTDMFVGLWSAELVIVMCSVKWNLDVYDYIACAATMTWVMGQRYTQTSKIMPAGVVSGISVLMTGFYLYKIATGGNRIPPKTE